MLGRLKNKLRHKGAPLPLVQPAGDPSPASASSDIPRSDLPPPPFGSSLSGTKTSKASAGDQIGLFALANDALASDKASLDNGNDPVDVVAIHGLGGNAYLTWTHPETGNLWLRDTLPSYIPDGRVYTFGYASKFIGNQSIATIPDFARALLDSLRNHREELGETRRSTIFVCHSLGGLVCKQALVFAHMDRKRYGCVLNSTIGVVFMGTPHCGSNLADLGDIVGRLINILSAMTTLGTVPSIIKRDLLTALAYDSRSLQELALSARQILGKIMVTSFYETLPQPPFDTPVVSAQSAILGLPDEEPLPLSANHRDICRFAYETPECARVCQAIRRMRKLAGSRPARPGSSRSSGSSTSELNHLERSCMKLFSHFDLREYKSRLPSPVHGTCTWIRSHPLFVAWAERAKSAMLWLTGHSGCGKTVLCHSVASCLEDGNQQVLMYFCDKKITSQQDGKAILTGLIFQIVQHNRRLIRHIRREFDICGANMIHSFPTLWIVFNNMIKDLKGDLYVVIDALDECETSSREILLRAIRGLINSSTLQKGNKPVKFLLTSRPTSLLSRGSDGVQEGLLEIDNGVRGYADDVRQFIYQRVDEIADRHSYPEHTKRHLLDAMLTKAGNTFLWTHLVLASLEDSLLASTADLDLILAALPSGLESTYSSFVSKISRANLSSAHRLLSLILASSRSLNFQEINYAFTITSHHQTSSDVQRDIQPAIARTVQGILGPLVRLSSQKVSLVHESLREFLLSSQDGAYPHQAHLDMPVITMKSAALHMANACILYLLLEDFQMINSSTHPSPINNVFGENGDDIDHDVFHARALGLDALDLDQLFQDPDANDFEMSKDVASRHPFYDYAAKNWHHHYALCEDISPTELSDSVMTLLGIDHTAGQTWRKYIRSQANDVDTEFPRESSSLVFACHLDLKEAAKDLLQRDRCSQHEMDEALFWSAKCGHARIVELLLDSGANPEYRGVERQTALLAAAAGGHLNCVKHLAGGSRRCDPNINSKTGRTALSLAAGNGHDWVVKYLLKNEAAAAAADDGDHSGVTPFMWASGCGHLAILSIFAKLRHVNINSQDANGRTALSWAAGDGMLDVVRHLLERIRWVDPNIQDKTGRTAFSWAAGNGHADVLSLLAECSKVDRYLPDNDQRSPLSWACGQGQGAAVRVLLSNKPRGLEDKDTDGWTPMAWAIHHNAPDTVEALFDAGARSLNEGPRSVLSWAVEYGHIDVIKMLLAKGADPESARDRIPFAQSMGRFDIVNALSHALSKQGF